MIQMFPTAEQSFTIPKFARLPVDVGMKILDRSSNDFGLMHYEVRRVIIVIFTIEECEIVLCRRAPKDVGYRNKFKKPVLVRQHGPVKQRTSSTAISIDEWVVIAYPEMQQD